MSDRLTVAQAIVRFLEVQYVERDGVETPFFAGCWGIFGHGNVAGVGQALLEREHAANEGDAGAQEHVLRYHQARNEQAMVHAAVGYARHRDRLAAFACTASVGPGSTNMVTGAALATINRIPVLLLPGDVFATRVANPVLQELEDPAVATTSASTTASSRSRASGTGSTGPSSCPLSLLAAMRVLTDPAETGAVTLSLPQDVQAEAWDWDGRPVRPPGLARRRASPSRAAPWRARSSCSRRAQRPLLVAGGGVIYSGATDALAGLRRGDRHPGGRDRRPARAACPTTTRCRSARSARPAPPPPTRWPREADVVIGVGTRYSDFTTGVQDGLRRPRRAVRQPQRGVVRRAQAVGGRPGRRRARGLEQLTGALDGWTRPGRAHRASHRGSPRDWDDVVQRSHDLGPRAAAGPVRGDRRGQHAHAATRTSWSCAAGSHAGRPAQAVAHPRPQGLPRRVRLLLHGLRDRRRPRRQDGRARRRRGPRRRRDGRRRLLPDDVAGARHRRPGGRQADRGPRAEPRLRLHRRALGVARVAAVRHPLPLPHRRPASTATCSRSTWPPTPPASARGWRRSTASPSSRRRSPRRRPPTSRP